MDKKEIVEMALSRPETFESIYGQGHIVKYLKERIGRGTLPQYLLYLGEEGLGKTTVLKLTAKALSCRGVDKPCNTCATCKEIDEKVIRNNQNTNNILTFKMSVDGSKEAVKDVLANLNTAFLKEGVPKIIILEECHGMPESSQDALLSDLEYLPKNVYVLMATTTTSKLTKALLSRFFVLNFNRLSKDEMVQLLTDEARRRHIKIQGGSASLTLIAEWAENKPRKALNVLEGFGNSSVMTMEIVKEYIGFIDIREVIPILTSFKDSGTITTGLYHIFNLQYGPSTTTSLITIFTEAVRVAHGEVTFRLSNEDYSLIRSAVSEVNASVLVEMLYHLCAVQEVTAPYLIASYLRAHPKGVNFETAQPEKTLMEETKFRNENIQARIDDAPVLKTERPTMQSILGKSKRIE